MVDGIDSGYASAATNTPERGSWNVPNADLEVSTGNIFRRKITKLKVFEREIPRHIRDRFLDLNELFEKPLYEFVTKIELKFGSISTRLKAPGEDEASAEHWIIVLCDQKVLRRVKQFFEQSHIKLEYEPHNTGSLTMDIPRFRLWVCNRPPRAIAGYDIVERCWKSSEIGMTLCGTSIKVGCRRATLGGIIQVTMSGIETTLLGMTAGHVVLQDEVDREAVSDHEVTYEGSDGDTSVLFGEEEFELDSALGSDKIMTEQDGTDRSHRSTPTFDAEVIYSKLGQVSLFAQSQGRNQRNLDWALVQIDDVANYGPNLLILPEKNCSSNPPIEIKERTCRSCRVKSGRSVTVVSGMQGTKSRTLSDPSFLMTDTASFFTQTYTLILKDGLCKDISSQPALSDD